MATVFSGGTYVNTTFVGTARQDLLSNIKAQLVAAGWTNVAQATSQGPGNVGTFTVTIASPGVCSFSGHGWLGGERVVLQTTGALPTGLSVNTVYFVKYIDANTFKLAATSGGTDINTSGSQSGTHTINTESVLLQSATQANVTNPIRVRLKDNRANCIQISIENQAGTLVGSNANTASGAGNLLPGAAKTYRIIATKYHFMVFTPGTSAAREFVMAGMLYVPSNLTGITDHGYVFSNAADDTSSSILTSFRTSTVLLNNNNGGGEFQQLWNSNLWDFQGTNMSAHAGCPSVVIQVYSQNGATSSATAYRWANDALLVSDVLMASGLTAQADESKIKGQFFDLIYVAEGFTIDTEDSLNGHNWHSISANNTATFPRGGYWLAID